MAAVAAALAPHEQALHHRVAHRAPRRGRAAPLAPPSSARLGECFTAPEGEEGDGPECLLGAGRVDGGGVVVEAVDGRERAEGEDLYRGICD
jgi:hypothetical protein